MNIFIRLCVRLDVIMCLQLYEGNVLYYYLKLKLLLTLIMKLEYPLIFMCNFFMFKIYSQNDTAYLNQLEM